MFKAEMTQSSSLEPITSLTLTTAPRMSRRSTLLSLPALDIGDTVHLPDGQQGILRFVGQIDGKVGEFAGIELVNEWVSCGKHNGEFEGQV